MHNYYSLLCNVLYFSMGIMEEVLVNCGSLGQSCLPVNIYYYSILLFSYLLNKQRFKIQNFFA